MSEAKYGYVLLDRGIPTKAVYVAGESREQLSSFLARDGWALSRSGDALTIAKGMDCVHVPWARVVAAVPLDFCTAQWRKAELP